MRSSPRRIAGASIAVFGLILSVLAVLAPTVSASVNDPSPESYTGNPGCSSFGYTVEAKINNQPTAQTYEYDDLQKSGAVPNDVEITISNVELVNDRLEFDWASNYEWSAVLVKQANGGLLYEYNPAVDNDQNVQTVSGQNQGGISHVTFCMGTPTQPTFGSLSVDKVVDDDADPQDPALAFAFTVDCTHNGQPVDLNGAAAGEQASFTLTDAQAAHVLSDIPTGASCTVTETQTQSADSTSMSVDGDTPIPGTTVSGVIVGQNSTVAVVAENTYEEEQCVPTTENNQCTPCPTGQIPDGQGNCDPPPPPPPPGPEAELSAAVECAEEDVDVLVLTITNAGDGAAVVDVTNFDEVVQSDVAVPANDSVTVPVQVLEDEEYSIGVTGLAPIEDTKDCEDVDPVVIPRDPEPTPDPEPTKTPPEEQVLGNVVSRQLPRTGSDTLPLAEAGLGLILLGTALTFTSRRQLRATA